MIETGTFLKEMNQLREMHKKVSFSYAVDKNNNVRPCVRPSGDEFYKGKFNEKTLF